jgi:hypothetical protein
MKFFIAFFLVFGFSAIALAQDPVVAATVPATGLLDMLKYWFEVASQLVFALTIVATIIVRVIPGKKDDEAVITLSDKFAKIMSMLPTWFINPRTKGLEAEIEALRKQNADSGK